MKESLEFSVATLTVGSNPQGTERTTRVVFVCCVIATALFPLLGSFLAAWAGSVGGFGMGAATGGLFVLTSWGILFISLRLAKLRGAQSMKRTVMILNSDGISSSIAQGDISLPWNAIGRISINRRGKHQILVFHVAPGVTPQSPGVSTTLSPKLFTALGRLGFQVGQVAVDTPIETVAAAAGAFTGGRLRLGMPES